MLGYNAFERYGISWRTAGTKGLIDGNTLSGNFYGAYNGRAGVWGSDGQATIGPDNRIADSSAAFSVRTAGLAAPFLEETFWRTTDWGPNECENLTHSRLPEPSG